TLADYQGFCKALSHNNRLRRFSMRCPPSDENSLVEVQDAILRLLLDKLPNLINVDALTNSVPGDEPEESVWHASEATLIRIYQQWTKSAWRFPHHEFVSSTGYSSTIINALNQLDPMQLQFIHSGTDRGCDGPREDTQA